MHFEKLKIYDIIYNRWYNEKGHKKNNRLLSWFGLFNIVTASSSEAVIRYEKSLFYYFFRQLFMIIGGLIISIFIIKKDTKKYPFYATIAFIGITACILYLFLYGTFHKGAQNWLSIGPVKFQPSEFAKPIIIVCLALIFDKAKAKLRSKKSKHFDIIGLILVVGLFNSVIIFLEKDLGTMLILVIIFMVMFMSSPNNILLNNSWYVWIVSNKKPKRIYTIRRTTSKI